MLSTDTVVESPSYRIFAIRGAEDLQADLPLSQLRDLVADETVTLWVDLHSATPETEMILRDIFAFHSLTIQDCFESQAHPKIEGFPSHVFLTVHGLVRGSTALEAETLELDVFLARRFLVTYHDGQSRSVDGVVEQVLRGGGPLRRGPGAMLHAILDRQIDGIEPVLDGVEEKIEELEARVFDRPRREDLMTLMALKRTTLQFRRWMSKQREVVLRLSRTEFTQVAPQDAILYRDIYDHLARFTDLVESHREMISSLQETYLNATNLRLGETMKFLTMFTAILMPLTLLTGIYGMNFEHMPELKSPWGYPAVLGAMVCTASAVLLFFRRKGWIGAADPGPPDGPSAK